MLRLLSKIMAQMIKLIKVSTDTYSCIWHFTMSIGLCLIEWIQIMIIRLTINSLLMPKMYWRSGALIWLIPTNDGESVIRTSQDRSDSMSFVNGQSIMV